VNKPKPLAQFTVVALVGGGAIIQIANDPGDTKVDPGPSVAYQITALSSAPADTGFQVGPQIAETILDQWIRLPGPEIIGVTQRPGFISGTRETGDTD
jgi:hypothetical protein